MKFDLLLFRNHLGKSQHRTMDDVEYITMVRNIDNQHWIVLSMHKGENSINVADGFRQTV